MSKRKQHHPEFKAKVALEALKGESEMNLDLMRLIDKQFLETPFYGVRQMTWHLRNDDHVVNEKRIRRLMRLMGLMGAKQRVQIKGLVSGQRLDAPFEITG